MTDSSPSRWATQLTALARDLAENRLELLQLRKALLQARENAIAVGHTTRWEYDNALLLGSRELQEQIIELETDIEEIIQAILLTRLMYEQGEPFCPVLDLRPR